MYYNQNTDYLFGSEVTRPTFGSTMRNMCNPKAGPGGSIDHMDQYRDGSWNKCALLLRDL